MTASAGRCPAEDQCASTERCRAAGGRRLPVANMRTNVNLAEAARARLTADASMEP